MLVKRLKQRFLHHKVIKRLPNLKKV